MGEYHVLSLEANCPVTITTLASPDLADQIYEAKPRGLSIVGKAETENIGIEKIIRNVLAVPSIRYLILCGEESEGHYSGNTISCLIHHGVDEHRRVIGSKGRKPVLTNVTIDEVNAFRAQITLIDRIGCLDPEIILEKLREVHELHRIRSASDAASDSIDDSMKNSFENRMEKPMEKPMTESWTKDREGSTVGSLQHRTPPGSVKTVSSTVPTASTASTAMTAMTASTAQVVQAAGKDPHRVKLDPAGYFVIVPKPQVGKILVEHYANTNEFLRMIRGDNARDIYWTIIQQGWVTELSHAAYLGKELTRAELSMQQGTKYVQDKA